MWDLQASATLSNHSPHTRNEIRSAVRVRLLGALSDRLRYAEYSEKEKPLVIYRGFLYITGTSPMWR